MAPFGESECEAGGKCAEDLARRLDYMVTLHSFYTITEFGPAVKKAKPKIRGETRIKRACR